jgi:hypothetical protein
MGFFDDLFGGTGKRLAREDREQQLGRETKSQGYLDRGYDTSSGYLSNALNAWAPLQGLAGQAAGGVGLYADSLGVNGAQGNQRAQSAFQAGPGYQWNVDQALDQTARRQNAMGGLGGNAFAALQDRASGLANQEFGNWRSSLGGLAQMGMGATAQAAGGVSQGYNNLGNLATGYGRDSSNLIQQVGQGVSRTYANEAQAAQTGAANLAGLGTNLLSLGAKAFGAYF